MNESRRRVSRRAFLAMGIGAAGVVVAASVASASARELDPDADPVPHAARQRPSPHTQMRAIAFTACR